MKRDRDILHANKASADGAQQYAIARTKWNARAIGQPLSQDKVEADLKSLIGTNWFSDATYHLEESPPKSGKYTLIFTVREMTLLKEVEFRGRRAIRVCPKRPTPRPENPSAVGSHIICRS